MKRGLVRLTTVVSRYRSTAIAGREEARWGRGAYEEREAVGEAEGADETEALVLGAGAAVPDDDGAAHRADAAEEDLRCPIPPARRLRRPQRPNRHG